MPPKRSSSRVTEAISARSEYAEKVAKFPVTRAGLLTAYIAGRADGIEYALTARERQEKGE